VDEKNIKKLVDSGFSSLYSRPDTNYENLRLFARMGAMADIKWIKISISMFDDEKIKIIESMPEKDTVLCIWIKLLSLAGKVNDNGLVYITESMPYNDEILATVFNRPLNTVKMAMNTFSRMDMISVLDNNKIHITNWSKYQNIDGMDKIRLDNRERKRLQREKLRELNMSHLSRDCHVTVTGQTKEKTKDKEKEEYKNTQAEASPLKKSTLTPIHQAYIDELIKLNLYDTHTYPYGKNGTILKRLAGAGATPETIRLAVSRMKEDKWLCDKIHNLGLMLTNWKSLTAEKSKPRSQFESTEEEFREYVNRGEK
jgi:predicted phage replisome organizer